MPFCCWALLVTDKLYNLVPTMIKPEKGSIELSGSGAGPERANSSVKPSWECPAVKSTQGSGDSLFRGQKSGPEQGVIANGVFSLDLSLESLESSRLSRKWSDSPLFATLWGICRISKKTPFQKTPFPTPKESHELILHELLNTSRGAGHPSKIFGTSQVPSL